MGTVLTHPATWIRVAMQYYTLIALTASVGLNDVRAEQTTTLVPVDRLLGTQQTPSRLICTFEGTLHTPKDAVSPGIPSEPRTSQQKRSYYIDFQNNLYRREVERESFGGAGFQNSFRIDVSDGKEFKEYSPKSKNMLFHSGKYRYNPELVLRKNSATALILDREDLSVLLAAGKLPTRSISFGDVTQLRVANDPSYYTASGVGLIGDLECLILQSGPTVDPRNQYEVWLAPALSNAAVRFAYRLRGNELFRLDIAYEHDHKRPRPSRVQYFSQAATGLVLRADLRCVDYREDAQIPASMFDVAITPGMIVQRPDAADWYQAGENGERGKSVRELVALESQSGLLTNVIIIFSALAIGGGGFALYWSRILRDRAR